jgi:hypothetical protein
MITSFPVFGTLSNNRRSLGELKIQQPSQRGIQNSAARIDKARNGVKVCDAEAFLSSMKLLSNTLTIYNQF